MGPKTNAKAVAGRERKAAAAAAKEAEAAAQREAEEAKEWQKGSNVKGAARAEAAALKADEATRKRREKEALLAAEEGDVPSRVKKPSGGAASKRAAKAKPKDGLALLEESLVSEADKKTRQAKRAERLRKEAAAAAANPKKPPETTTDPESLLDPLGPETALVGRQANVAALQQQMQDGWSGVDGALASLSVASAEPMTYKEFEERIMPQVKQDYPSLKLSQYRERIFQLWKKSPENPQNQKAPEGK